MLFRLFPGFSARALGLLAFVGVASQPAISQASSPFLTIPDAGVAESTAAYRYANMTNDEAVAELNRRGLPYVTVNDPVAGVRAPIRLTGRLHGVLIHSGSPEKQRATSPFEILDARLALALDDFTAILEKHDIDEIEHFSMYRPEVVRKTEKPAPNNPPAQVLTEKPVPPMVKETPVATGTKKVTNRGKPAIAQVAKKPPRKTTGLQKPAVKSASAKKPTTPMAPKATAPASPNKPTQKPSANLNKTGLGAKTSASSEKPHKQKGPGEGENTEPVGTDKQPEIVTAPVVAQATGSTAPAGLRHPGGLAIDVGKLRKKDGTWINVATHFHGKIGEKACGADAPVPTVAEAKELRTLVCDAMDKHIFTYVLTPNYNAAHRDHFHMEIKPGVKWFMVH